MTKQATTVCGRSLDELLNLIEEFHAWKAPALLIGAFMVDWAQEAIPAGVEFDAFVETYHCLPDAVQLLTPCTFGNGWMKVLDWDKFALSLYDKKKLNGVRVWLDLEKTGSYPYIYDWYMRQVPKKSIDHNVLRKEIVCAGRSMLSRAPVHVTQLYGKKEKGEIAVCSGCGEAYPTEQGERCLACLGNGYYEY